MLSKIAYSFNLKVLIELLIAYPLVFTVMLTGFLIHWIPVRIQETVRGKFINTPLWLKTVIVLCVLYILYLFIQSDIQPFIYFRF